MGQDSSFGLGAATSGFPMLPPIVQNLQAGMARGAGPAQFIADQSLPNNFYAWLGELGDAAENGTTDANGNPVAFDDLSGKHTGSGQHMSWYNSPLVFEPGGSTANRAS